MMWVCEWEPIKFWTIDKNLFAWSWIYILSLLVIVYKFVRRVNWLSRFVLPKMCNFKVSASGDEAGHPLIETEINNKIYSLLRLQLVQYTVRHKESA